MCQPVEKGEKLHAQFNDYRRTFRHARASEAAQFLIFFQIDAGIKTISFQRALSRDYRVAPAEAELQRLDGRHSRTCELVRKTSDVLPGARKRNPKFLG